MDQRRAGLRATHLSGGGVPPRERGCPPLVRPRPRRADLVPGLGLTDFVVIDIVRRTPRPEAPLAQQEASKDAPKAATPGANREGRNLLERPSRPLRGASGRGRLSRPSHRDGGTRDALLC